MPPKFSYAASEMMRQLDRGTHPGEDFFRLQVTGNQKTRWVNISREQLVQIAAILDSEEFV